jgi:hypothetical protein
MGSWSRYVRILAGTLAGALALFALVIFVGNPYGNIAVSPLRHVLMDDNQRFQYPAVIRSRRYVSLVVGTSTARLLEPKQLEAEFGGRFANLALNSGTAWEQWQIVRLFKREVASPGTLVVGLDGEWCQAAADQKRITTRGFPEWQFDANPWNDALYMLNTRALEIAGRRLGHALGLARERWPHDGYEVFTPPDETYDLARARGHIWKGQAARTVEPLVPAFSADPALRRAWPMPALPWLEDILKSPPRFARVILAFMPIHVAAQPRPGSEAAAREAECKARIRALADRHQVLLVDLRFPSTITTRDENYWDPLHYRQGIAREITDLLGEAAKTGTADRARGAVIGIAE